MKITHKTSEEYIFDSVKLDYLIEGYNHIEKAYKMSIDNLDVNIYSQLTEKVINKCRIILPGKMIKCLYDAIHFKYQYLIIEINENIKSNKPVYTYIIKNEMNGKYKIGKSIDVHKRFMSLKHGGVGKLNIIYTCPINLEYTLHKKYKQKRLNGEWFDLNIDDVLDIISFCKKELKNTKPNPLGLNETVINDKKKLFNKKELK